MHSPLLKNKVTVNLSVAVAALVSAGMAETSVAQNSPSGFELEEIVITARKIEENLQDAPLAVSAMTGESLEERGVEQITAVANIAPNVNFSYGGAVSGSGSAAVMFIRGVGQNDFTLVTDPGVGLYVDGVYYSRTIGSVLDVFDVDRIEVLRGPQGTLFGRNSTGGAINITSRNPDGEFGAKVKATIGDDSRQEMAASVNLPVNENFAVLISSLVRKRDGNVNDASGRELGDDDMYGMRIKGLWTPDPDFSLIVSADYVSENEGSAAEVPLVRNMDGSVSSSTRDNYTPVTVSQGKSVNDTDALGFSVTAEWTLTENATLKSITGYRDLDSTFARAPASASDFSTLDTYEHKQISEEIQLLGTVSNVNYVAGVFYMQEEGSNEDLTNVGVAPSGWPRIIGVEDVDNKNYAVFGEATWNLTDTTRIITGLRYTHEEKEVDQISQSIPGITRGTTASDPVVNYIGYDGLQPLDYSERTWRLALQQDIHDHLMVYASVSRGFKSGGFEQRVITPVTEPDTFKPEYVRSYEVGLKTDLESVRVNVAAFKADYTDLQISGNPPGSIATETFNGAEATIQGLEIELTWIPAPSFMMDLSIGIMDAEYDDIEGTANITLRDELIRTPEYSVAMGVSYLYDIGTNGSLKFRADLVSKGETHFEPDNDTASYEDGYTALDFNVAYFTANADWTVRLGVNNATNEKYLIAGDANIPLGYDLGIFARERNVYLSVEKIF